MSKSNKKHNISKTQPNPTVKFKDIVIQVYAIKVLSLSFI
jgi:hypothetical protein